MDAQLPFLGVSLINWSYANCLSVSTALLIFVIVAMLHFTSKLDCKLVEWFSYLWQISSNSHPEWHVFNKVDELGSVLWLHFCAMGWDSKSTKLEMHSVGLLLQETICLPTADCVNISFYYVVIYYSKTLISSLKVLHQLNSKAAVKVKFCDWSNL